MEVSTLESLCLSSVAVQPKAIPPAALSLLPLHIRRELLRLLAAVDIWRLEACPDFTRGLDMEDVWRERLGSHVLSWAVNVEYKEQDTARESYLHHISRVLVLSFPRGFRRRPVLRLQAPGTVIDKWCYLSFLLHGVVCDGGPPPSRYVSFQFDARCLTAPQYRHLLRASRSSGSVLSFISYLLQKSGWHPRVLEVGRTEHIDSGLVADPSNVSFRDFVSQIEDILLAVGGDEVTMDAMGALTLLQVTAAKSQRLKSLSIEAVHYVLAYLIPKLTTSYGGKARGTLPAVAYGFGGYSKLRKVEVTRVINRVADSHHPVAGGLGDEWGIFLLQDEIEELRLSGLAKDTPDSLSNFLPHLIATRPSLRCLHLDKCQINWNAFENIVKAFLCTPTTHVQTLDLGTCWTAEESHTTFSFMRRSSLCPHLSNTCQNGELKTLRVPFAAGGVCCLPWILDQPNLQLRRLDLTLHATENDLLQTYRILSSRPSPLPVPIITLCLYSSPMFFWRLDNSPAIKQLISCPEVREITAANLDLQENILVVYSSLT